MKNEGSLLSLRCVHYRDKLNSCNYTCSYCPPGKKSYLVDTTQDEQAWNRFIAAIEQWKGEPLQLFIIPCGEALTHRCYRKGMTYLAALPQVSGISCQINLSFPAKRWLDGIRVAPTAISKIRLWASFHPEMTSVEKFTHQIHILHHAEIQVYAGAVENPSAKAALNDSWSALLPDIYLFINAMQGLRAPLSQEDIQFFSQLDNLFEYDLKNAPAQWEICAGGRDSCFIDWKGDMYACPRSRMKIGNFCQGDGAVVPLSCKRKVCSCYIIFGNLSNHPLYQTMGEGAFWRIPDKPLIMTVFFDVDGTLANSQGKIPESYANALRYMARSIFLYLTTSLSMERAKKKLGKALFDLFRGGMFADGGLLFYSWQIKCLPVKVYPEVYGEPARITIHSYEGVIYKYSILVRDREQRGSILARLKENPYQVFHKAPLITVIHPEAGKKEGVLQLCKALGLAPEHALVVGNSLKNRLMISVVSHSCAIMNTEPLLEERARCTLNPDRLAAFSRFSNGDPIGQALSDSS